MSRLLLALLLALVLAACEPGAAISARNQSSQDLIMVYPARPADGMRFLVPANSSVNLLPIGGSASGAMDVYTTDCHLIRGNVAVAPLGLTMISVDSNLDVSSGPAQQAQIGELPGAKRLGVGLPCP